MIMLFCPDDPQSTHEVIAYLILHKKEVVRIDENTEIKAPKICFSKKQQEIILTINDRLIDFNIVKSCWFRGSSFRIKAKENCKPEFQNYIIQEGETLIAYLMKFLNDKKSIGGFSAGNINKLIVLEEAKRCGLEIPKTIISASKKEIVKFFEENDGTISKSIAENFQHISEKDFYNGKVRKVTSEKLEKIKDEFFLSLLQEQINKAYELRIFYLAEKFYSMAIFSQNDEKTKIDYRNYNYSKPNRMVPYKLPAIIEEKLQMLMDTLKLNTGSIDMIVDKDDNYIFLEVNPNGQYGIVSNNCNYYLEKEIAEYLM